MSRWMRCNRWAGLVIFGFPTAVGAAAAAGTIARFGLAAVAAAGPALLVIALPVLLWVIYWRRSDRSATTRARWTAALVLALVASLVALATTPIGFMSGPGTGVLLSELTRLTVVAHLHRGRTSTRPAAPRAAARTERGQQR